MSNTLIIHPRVEASFRFRPTDYVAAEPPYIEAGRTTLSAWKGITRPASIRVLTTLEFLVAYDWRGSNKFQEEENLGFLRMYLQKYPEVAHYFEGIGPTYWGDI